MRAWAFFFILFSLKAFAQQGVSPDVPSPPVVEAPVVPVQSPQPPPPPEPIAPPVPPEKAIESKTEPPPLPSVGHNMSATGDLFPAGLCSVGLQFLACGVNSWLTLGSSPWILRDYHTANFAARIGLAEDAEAKYTLQLTYFKSMDNDREPLIPDPEIPGYVIPPAIPGSYQMEAYWVLLIKTEQLSPWYRLHTNLQLQYYRDDVMPISLRRPSFTQTPLQINLMTLHEIRLVSHWFMLGEMGVADINRNPAHLQVGASIGRDGSWWSWHIGFSMTSTFKALFDPVSRRDYQAYLRSFDWRGYKTDLDPDAVENDFAIHPEFSAQFFF